MNDATIHLRVPAETKARWVRESREAGQKLTSWIVEKIDGTARPIIDLREDPSEPQRWYVVVYDAAHGPAADVQELQPDWTDDYYIVITEGWYPGSTGDWKASIGRRVLEALAQERK